MGQGVFHKGLTQWLGLRAAQFLHNLLQGLTKGEGQQMAGDAGVQNGVQRVLKAIKNQFIGVDECTVQIEQDAFDWHGKRLLSSVL